jgi:hypothetical protein
VSSLERLFGLFCKNLKIKKLLGNHLQGKNQITNKAVLKEDWKREPLCQVLWKLLGSQWRTIHKTLVLMAHTVS